MERDGQRNSTNVDDTMNDTFAAYARTDAAQLRDACTRAATLQAADGATSAEMECLAWVAKYGERDATSWEQQGVLPPAEGSALGAEPLEVRALPLAVLIGALSSCFRISEERLRRLNDPEPLREAVALWRTFEAAGYQPTAGIEEHLQAQNAKRCADSEAKLRKHDKSNKPASRRKKAKGPKANKPRKTVPPAAKLWDRIVEQHGSEAFGGPASGDDWEYLDTVYGQLKLPKDYEHTSLATAERSLVMRCSRPRTACSRCEKRWMPWGSSARSTTPRLGGVWASASR